MSQHDATESGLPSPTIAPAIVALGITLLAAGLVTTLPLTFVGLLVFAAGLAHWIQELRHG